MRGPENMASDSEPRKFWGPPRGPLRSHISGSKKPVRLLMSNDSAGVEVWPIATAAAAELHRAQYSSSFLTAPFEKVFFRSVLMKPHRACTHDGQSFVTVSPRLS